MRVPVGSVTWVGASSSSSRCCFGVSRARSAAASGTRARCARRVAPPRNGSSHARSSISAAFDESGHSPPRAAHELDARDEVAALVVPGQRLDSERPQAFEQSAGRGVGRNVDERLVVDHELPEPKRAARDYGLRARVPDDFLALDELGREVLDQVFARERRREQDPRVALAVVDVDHDDEFLACDRLRIRERRAASVRELIATAVSRPALRDPVRIREREQNAGLDVRVGAVRIAAHADLVSKRTLEAAHALERRVARAAVQEIQAAPDVAVALAASGAAAAQHVALRQQRRELGARARRAEITRGQAASARAAGGARARATRGHARSRGPRRRARLDGASRSRAAESVAAGGASSQSSAPASVPQTASSSASGARSAVAISGGACAASVRCALSAQIR